MRHDSFKLIPSSGRTPSNYNSIKVGNTTLRDDVTYNPNFFTKRNNRKIKKEDVERAVRNSDIKTMRTISNAFFDSSGIYSRLCRYMAYLYRYDFFVSPVRFDNTITDDKMTEGWYKACLLLEDSKLKSTFGDIALQVVCSGVYYGYKIFNKKGCFLQDLPVNYCRSKYKVNGVDVVELNMKYFDDTFSDAAYRMRVLKLFPKEIQKGYAKYKLGELPKEYAGDDNGWFILDNTRTVKFTLSKSEKPLFFSVIPAILDLEEAQDLDRQKMLQEILKIIVQQFPIDKNGDLVFDMDEMAVLHNNAVQMLSSAIGVNVLSTVADVEVADMSDKYVSSVDQLEKKERAVYNEAGVSQMQFNSDSNMALQKSTLNDEGTMRDLLLQFQDYAESLLVDFNRNPKRLRYRVEMLPTTIYNYQEVSKLYQGLVQVGFSKMLPLVALGHSQINIISTALFENNVLNLNEVFVAPAMSSTISSKEQQESNAKGEEANSAGRPQLQDEEKSDKTIANIESGEERVNV